MVSKSMAQQLLRVQIALWLPTSCAHCGRKFVSVDDFLARDPRAGRDWGKPGHSAERFVDAACWDAYKAEKGF